MRLFKNIISASFVLFHKIHIPIRHLYLMILDICCNTYKISISIDDKINLFVYVYHFMQPDMVNLLLPQNIKQNIVIVKI